MWRSSSQPVFATSTRGTREDWETFRDQRVEPVVSEVLAAAGIPYDHSVFSFEAIDVVDTWVGQPA